MSRKPHQPTAETRQDARMFSARGLRQADIAVLLGISEKTLRLYYRAELDEGNADAIAAIIETLLKLISQGNAAAAMFYSKCRGGRRPEQADAEWYKTFASPDAQARFRAFISDPPAECVKNMERYVWNELGIGLLHHDMRDEEILAAIAICEVEIAAAEELEHDVLFGS